MRIILYTGKGGVGKTSLSAATAIGAARKGKRVIVMSTDSAHSLADALDLPIGPEPTKIADNLYAEEVSVHRELKRHWVKIQDYIMEFLTSQGYESYIAEELAVLPGMEELFSLLKLLDHHESGNYDAAVLDCAPTGATLKMLGFTDVFEWYMERFFDLERKILRTIRPIAERIIKAPLPHDDVYEAVEVLYHKMLAIRDLLTDTDTTSIRLVCNPEKMVIKESRRAYTYLNLFGYPVDMIISNRQLPPEASGGYLDKWIATQKRYSKQIHESFDPIPIRTVPLFPEEMVGLKKLELMAQKTFGDDDPTEIFYRDQPMKITGENGSYILSIKMPNVEKKDLDLWVKDGELIVSALGYQRHIMLPGALRDLDLIAAKYNDGRFDISFEKV